MIHGISNGLSRFKNGHTFFRDRDLLAGSGISSDTGGFLFCIKGSKSHQTNLFSILQRLFHGIEEEFDGFHRLIPGKSRLFHQ